MGHDFGGYRVHLYHAIARYASALQNDDFRERELAGEFLDSIIDTLIEAEARKRERRGPLARLIGWLFAL